MHLERIEISGFKSFADKTVIAFDKGVTAVVGPNGSGKSNISEAVRWVLGEQSAKNLRGKKMNDIVFAGSQTRKAINIAEVTLVLNNEDHSLPLEFTEISLTRRINRNGESECFINKKPCRLKDITDLLMDSGIGKDSFSMISQGKVEQIFQNKPEERRAIFEDAAGVAKYKNRKTSAERKLQDTQDHLNRVEDILYEIENQLEPLRFQRNTALSYKEMRATLSEIEIALMVVEVETLNEQWQLSKTELDQLNQQVKTFEEQQENGEEKVASLQNNVATLEESIQVLQEELLYVVQQVEKIAGRKNILAQRADFSAKNKEEQTTILASKRQAIETATTERNQVDELRSSKRAIRQQLQSDIDLLAESQRALESNQEDRLQQVRDAYIQTLQEQTATNNSLTHLVKEQTQTSHSLGSKRSAVQQVRSSLKQAIEEAQRLEVSKEQQEKHTIKLQKEVAFLTEKRSKAEMAYKEGLNKQQLLQRKIQQAEARRDSLQELEDSYASYYQGVKEILKRRKVLEGIHGTVGELFTVPEQVSLAIETTLGAAVQHVVVSNEGAASKAIHVLKANRLGRATFLPISVIKARSIPSYLIHECQQMDGFVGIAVDLIETEAAYQTIAMNLLGTTIISRDLASGVALSKRSENRYRVVSLEGDVIHAGGSMTGGATKKQQTGSVFSRKNTIEELTKQIEADQEALQNQTSALNQAYQLLQESSKALTEQSEALRNEQYMYRSLCEQLERGQALVTELEKNDQATTFELTQLEQSLQEVEAQLVDLREMKECIADSLIRLKRHMEESTVSEEERSKRLQRIQVELNEKKQEVAILLEQEKQLNRDRTVLSERIAADEQTIRAIEATLQQADLLETEELESAEELAIQLNEQTAEQKRIESLVTKQKNEKKILEQQLKDEEQTLQYARNMIRSLWEQRTKLESKSSRTEVAIDHHLNRLSEEYGLSFDAAKASHDLAISTDQASKQVKELKRSIEALGPINLASIEEYDRIEERYEFLTSQQKDLLEAKQMLVDTMNEMDAEVSTRFETMFNRINHQFEQTFPRLFGGGKATMQLTDPSNMLETGIEIIAQPPGKKNQQLSLLSGGEKAFTAIALLFAIIEVSPVPFCILDEVEAALDEANVVRFGKYLSSFEKQTQFIVITHRKGTMEEADVLYGVTMQDSGVSRLASVRFHDQLVGSE